MKRNTILLSLLVAACTLWLSTTAAQQRTLPDLTNPSVRAARIAMLELLPLDQVLPRLKRALADRHYKVRLAALRVMVVRRIMSATVLALSSKDADQRVRLAAVRGLGVYDGNVYGPTLLNLLQHSSPSMRIAAARALVQLRYQPAWARLIKLLYDRSLQVRVALVGALQKWPGPTFVERLLELVLEPSAMLRQKAMQALAALKVKKALPILLQRLGMETAEGKMTILATLGKLGDPRATPMLLSLIWKKDPVLSTAAIDALGFIGDKRAIRPLLKYLTYSNDGQYFAVTALKRIGPPVIPEAIKLLQRMPRGKVLRQLLNILVFFKARQAVPIVGRMLSDPTRDRLLLVKSLRLIGDARAVGPLLALAVAARGELLVYCVRALAESGQRSLVKTIAGFLTHRDLKVRLAVIQGLARFKSPLAAAALAGALSRNRPALQRQILIALREIGSPVGAEKLFSFLGNPDSQIRHLASEALGATGDAAQIPPLLKLARSSLFLGRRDALRALGPLLRRHRLKRVISLIEEMLESDEPATVLAALTVLGQVRHPGSYSAMFDVHRHKSPSIRHKLADILGNLPKSSRLISRLISLLGDRHTTVRTHAIWSLGNHRVARLAPVFRKLLRSATRWQVRANAARGLARFGDKSAIPLLSVCLRSLQPYLVASCSWALGHLKARRAIPALHRALVRTRNATALGSIVRSLWLLTPPDKRKQLRLQLNPYNKRVVERALKPVVRQGRRLAEVELRDASYRPFVNEAYVLLFPDGELKVGLTDPVGLGREDDVPKKGMSWIFPKLRF